MAENSQSSSPAENRDDWGPCPAGTVSGLVGKLKHRQRRRQLKQVAVVTGSLLLLVFAGRSLVISNSAAHQTTLTHQEVVELADDYIQDRLDEEHIQLVEAHIDICPRCRHLREDRRHYLEQTNTQTLPLPRSASRLLARSH